MNLTEMQTVSEQYVEARSAIEHMESNDERVMDYLNLKMLMEEAQDKLKVAVKEQKEDLEVGDYNFQFVTKYRKWIDYKEAKSLMKNNAQKHLLESITETVQTVDMKQFVELVRLGQFPEEVRVKAYREEEMSPSVTIKPIK